MVDGTIKDLLLLSHIDPTAAATTAAIIAYYMEIESLTVDEANLTITNMHSAYIIDRNY